MKKLISTTTAIAMSIIAVGCASRPENISAAYVSPIAYQGLSCSQIANEVQAVSARAAAATGVQSKKATGDAVAMGVGLIVFWPALLFMQGDGASAAEVARLKGEMEALETASRQNNCGIVFEAAPVKKQPSLKKTKHPSDNGY